MKKLFCGNSKAFKHRVCSFKAIFLFLILQTSFQHTSFAQYPVTSRTIIKTPYSPSLSDYYTGTDPRLTLYLTNTDIRQPVIRARLRLNISSSRVNLRSRDFVGPIIELDAGTPQYLSGMDLAIYFNPGNMDVVSGLDYNALFKSPRLPDGTYKFRFDVIEAFTGRILNDVNFPQLSVNILSNDPPFLNLPRKGDNIRFTDPLNIIFNWTPRAVIKGLTDYEFSLYEIHDNGMPPENAPFMSQPIYQTTTQTTTLLYGPTEPPLLPGKKYAWRVRAIAKQGIDSYSIYNNDGYTETYWFQLNDNCDPIQQIASTVRAGAVTLEWPDNPQMYEYTVEYRKKGDWNRWFSTTTKNNKVIITDVAPGNTYEYRVGGTCTVGAGETFSDIRAFTIPPRDSIRDKQCGVLPNINLSNQKSIEILSAGESVMVGDFPTTIISIMPNGDGSFSGVAAIRVDIFRAGEAALKATFSNVVFNTDKQMIKGFMVATYDKTEGQIVDLDKDISTDSNPPVYDTVININVKDIKSITIDSTQKPYIITITDSNGQKIILQASELPFTIQDKEGKVYTIDKDGNITPGGKPSITAGNDQDVKYPYEQFVYKVLDFYNAKIRILANPALPAKMRDAYEQALNQRIQWGKPFTTTTDNSLNYNDKIELGYNIISQKAKDSALQLSGKYPKDIIQHTINNNNVQINLPDHLDSNMLQIGHNIFEVNYKKYNQGVSTALGKLNIIYKDYTIDDYRIQVIRNGNTYEYKDGDKFGDGKSGEKEIEAGKDELTLKLIQIDKKDPSIKREIDSIKWAMNNDTAKAVISKLFKAVPAQEEDFIIAYKKDIAIKLYFKVIVKNPSQSDFDNVDVSTLNSSIQAKRVDMFNEAIKRIKEKDPELIAFAKNRPVKVNVVYKTHPEMAGAIKEVGGDADPTKILYGFANANEDAKTSLLELDQIQKDGNIIKNARVLAKLTIDNKQQLEIAIAKKQITEKANELLNWIRQYNANMADSMQSLILNGNTDTALIGRIRYIVNEQNLDQFYTIKFSKENGQPINMNVYLNENEIENSQTGFTQTLAHELKHLFFADKNRLEKLKWITIRKKKDVYNYSLADGLGTNGSDNCSSGAGHEMYNPESSQVCGTAKNY